MDLSKVDTKSLGKATDIIAPTLQILQSNLVDNETKELAKKTLKHSYSIMSEITEIIDSIIKENATPENKRLLLSFINILIKEQSGKISEVLKS